MLIGMPPQGAPAAAAATGGGVDINGKDVVVGTTPGPTRPPPSLPLKLLRPLLLVAVLGTGLLAVVVLLLGGGPAATYYYSSMLPRLPTTTLPAAPADGGGGKAALERFRRPPAPSSASAWHNMSDEELLWAASWRPAVARYPFRRTPKVAFMFLTRGPLPLHPLWDRFFSGAGKGEDGEDGGLLFSVYVHATPGYRPDFPPSSAFYRRLVPSQVAAWGETSILDAERRLLANALLDPNNQRFVLLSESCIPLYSFPSVYAYLTHSHDSFVGAFDDPGPHGRGRYRAGLAPEVERAQFRKGAQWFELDRELAVDQVVADDRYYPKFRDHCRPPCYVDEHYLPTVLSIESPARIANRSVTWVDWSRGGAHPAMFGEKDVHEGFLRWITAAGEEVQGNCSYNGQPAEVCFLFARKFAPSTLGPLLSLAPKLLGYG